MTATPVGVSDADAPATDPTTETGPSAPVEKTFADFGIRAEIVRRSTTSASRTRSPSRP